MADPDVFQERDFARFYDWTSDEGGEDIDFFLGLARRQGGPVLDVGCGTGRVAIPLARKGIDVVGIDASAEMIAMARTKIAREPKSVRDRISLERADMRVFDLGRAFPAVFVPAASLFHLADAKAFASCFSRLRSHTRRGGVAAIDLVSPMRMASQQIGEDELVREGINRTTRRFTREWNRKLEISRENQTVRIRHVFEEGKGEAVKRFVFEQDYRWIEKNEGIHLLQAAGFSDIRATGSYEGTPYTDSSPRLILVANRPDT